MNAAIAARGMGSPYDTAIADAAASAGLDVALVKGVIAQESAWRPDAVNAADPSYGLMQVNTRAHPDVSPALMLDPAQNIAYGTAYLGQQVARYGVAGGVSAYNAGVPIAGNALYVREVLAYQVWYQANDPASSLQIVTDPGAPWLDPMGGPTDPGWGLEAPPLELTAPLALGAVALLAWGFARR